MDQSAQPLSSNPNPQPNTSYVEDYVPPAQPSSPVSQPPAVQMSKPPETKVSQTLEDQNIFHLLGIESATSEEKEAFLDELQQVIWEDFLEHDVELLLTEEELVEFKKIADKPNQNEEERQSAMITFLEKLVPDLENIMLEKALELKEEMVRERITELRNMFSNKIDVLSLVERANSLIDDQQWRSAADILNTIKT